MALRTPLSVTPHLYMGDSTGRPLDNGVVYFGEQDKDPEFYPIDLFSDDALTKPLAQPVHTKGGYLYDKGDMVEPHAKEIIYSVKVLDSYGRKVFYKGAMMRNSWNDDVIEQINAAIVASTNIARQVATDITNEAINNTAVEGGVLADTFVVVDGTLSQRTINKGLESIADLLTIANPKDGLRVYVKSYHVGLNKGGGVFIYDSTKADINDGGYIFNGWVRQLVSDALTPEMFGAIGDGINDDAPAIRKCFTAAYEYGVGNVELLNKYLLNSPKTVGEPAILSLYPNVNVLGKGTGELIVGDAIPDNNHILSGGFFIITEDNIGNFEITGLNFTKKSALTNMKTYSSNLAIHTMGLNNVLIRDCVFDELDTSNVIACGIEWDGVQYGSNITVENNRFLKVVAENSINIDHSTLYVQAKNSVVRNNVFRGATTQQAKVSCCVEIHAKDIEVYNNKASGYSRFVWFAAQPNNVTNCHVYNNTASVANHFAIFSSYGATTVTKCSIRNNTVRCAHVTSDLLYSGYQGIAVTSGILEGATGWSLISEILIEDNILHIDYSANAEFATCLYLDQEMSCLFKGNTVYGAVAGMSVINLTKHGGVVENNFITASNDVAHVISNYIEVTGTNINAMSIRDNKFNLNYANRPDYLIGFPNAEDTGIEACIIKGNKLSNSVYPRLGQLFFKDTVVLNINSNVIDVEFYSAAIAVPAMEVGVVKKVPFTIPNYFKGLYAETIIVPSDDYYIADALSVCSATGEVSIKLMGLKAASGYIKGTVRMNIFTT